jgi:hypothetical protein
MKLNITAHNMIKLSIIVLSLMVHNSTALSIMILNITAYSITAYRQHNETQNYNTQLN